MIIKKFDILEFMGLHRNAYLYLFILIFFPLLKIILNDIIDKINLITFDYHCPQAGRAFTFCLETESKQRIQGFIKISKIWL